MLYEKVSRLGLDLAVRSVLSVHLIPSVALLLAHHLLTLILGLVPCLRPLPLL